MAIFIPTTCPICSADTHSTVPQRKDGALKGRIKTKCLECGFEKEIFIDFFGLGIKTSSLNP